MPRKYVTEARLVALKAKVIENNAAFAPFAQNIEKNDPPSAHAVELKAVIDGMSTICRSGKADVVKLVEAITGEKIAEAKEEEKLSDRTLFFRGVKPQMLLVSEEEGRIGLTALEEGEKTDLTTYTQFGAEDYGCLTETEYDRVATPEEIEKYFAILFATFQLSGREYFEDSFAKQMFKGIR